MIYTPTAGTGILSVTDVAGRPVQRMEVSLKNGENIFQLDLGDAASGVYFLDIQTNGHSTRRKLIKL